jgi:hypothetical protein
MLARARSGKKRSPAKAVQMDDEVQAILDKAFNSLRKRGYDFRMEVSYQKEGLSGSIIQVPMPTPGQKNIPDRKAVLYNLIELIRIEMALLKGLDDETCERFKTRLTQLKHAVRDLYAP